MQGVWQHHILWIDKWVHYNPNRPHLSPQTILKVSRKYLVTGSVQKIPLWCVCGSSPTQIGSHIHLNLNHVQGVWQPSDAVDGHMDASSSYYHHTWYCWFGMWAEIDGHWRYMKNIIMLWLRLKPHPYWFTTFSIMHSKASTICGVACSIDARCLTTFSYIYLSTVDGRWIHHNFFSTTHPVVFLVFYVWAETPGQFWAANDTNMLWLRGPHTYWFPYPPQTCLIGLTRTFNGCSLVFLTRRIIFLEGTTYLA